MNQEHITKFKNATELTLDTLILFERYVDQLSPKNGQNGILMSELVSTFNSREKILSDERLQYGVYNLTKSFVKSSEGDEIYISIDVYMHHDGSRKISCDLYQEADCIISGPSLEFSGFDSDSFAEEKNEWINEFQNFLELKSPEIRLVLENLA